jgi:hypothetical protein
MAGDVVSTENAVCLAVCVGWRIAQLYDSDELPGPSAHQDAVLPPHLPGFGEMSDHERARALAVHVGADLTSMRDALGLDVMPTVAPVLEALKVPRHSRDDVRAVVLDLYLEVRDLIAGSDVSAATAFGLGRMLADTTLLPTDKAPQILAERFEEHRLANAFGWLDDLDAKLPSRSAATVRATLAEWEQWVARLSRTPQGAIDPTALTEAAIRALRRQGDIWRRLLTGEKRPDQLLDSQAYIGAAIKLLGAACRVGRHYLWRWSWAILLAAGLVAAAIWAPLAYAPAGTSRVAAVVVPAAGFLGISWLGIRATLGRALRQAEGALWEAEVTAAIAKAAATTPKNRKLSVLSATRRGSHAVPSVHTQAPNK